MQPVGGHEFDTVLFTGVDHLLAFRLSYGQRLLTEHMYAGACRTHGKVAMHRVWQTNIDGIDLPLAQHLVIILIWSLNRDTIPSSQLPALFFIVRKKSGQSGVSGGMLECGQHSSLCNMSQPYNCVADRP